MAEVDPDKIQETDAEAVAHTLEDGDYFSILIMRYEQKLSRYIWRLGVSTREDREDVLQNTFVSAYRNLHAYDQSLQFSSWIYRIAHNEAMTFLRKSAVRKEYMRASDSNMLLDLLAGEESASRMALSKESEEALQNALGALAPRYRDVLLLRYFEEKSYEEISDILEVPLGTVATLVSRGKQRLREVLHKSKYDYDE